jgi:hypothetical protein
MARPPGSVPDGLQIAVNLLVWLTRRTFELSQQRTSELGRYTRASRKWSLCKVNRSGESSLIDGYVQFRFLCRPDTPKIPVPRRTSARLASSGSPKMNTKKIIRLDRIERAAMHHHERGMRSGNVRVAKRAAKLWAVARARSLCEVEIQIEPQTDPPDTAA